MVEEGGGAVLSLWWKGLPIGHGEVGVFFWYVGGDLKEIQEIKGGDHGFLEGDEDRWVGGFAGELFESVPQGFVRLELPVADVYLLLTQLDQRLDRFLMVLLSGSFDFLHLDLNVMDTFEDAIDSDVDLLNPLVLAIFQLLVEFLDPIFDGGFDFVFERSAVVILLEQRAECAPPGAVVEPCEDVLHSI